MKTEKEILEAVRVLQEANPNDEGIQNWVRYYFPELKDSEDERIRKALINGFNKLDKSAVWYNGITNGQILAWLEKQQKPVIEMKTPEESLGIDSNTYNKIVDECIYGEQKPADKSEPTDYNSIDPYFGKPIDKVEPKFHEGEWITNGEYTWFIEGTHNSFYDIISPEGCGTDDTITHVDDNFHIWTIQDAKPGDVLATKDTVFIFNHLDKTGLSLCKSYCEVIGNSKLGFGFEFSINSVYPATKEQRDQLEKAMADAGYTFDLEKKELKKIEQKPAWSEDDDEHLERILKELGNQRQRPINSPYLDKIESDYNWLKSLKDRVQPKQEWSKEDEVKINRIVACLENLNVADNDMLLKDVDWLKSLKPQSQWKPSDEQMDELRKYSDNVVLRNLYYNLKKLKE